MLRAFIFSLTTACSAWPQNNRFMKHQHFSIISTCAIFTNKEDANQVFAVKTLARPNCHIKYPPQDEEVIKIEGFLCALSWRGHPLHGSYVFFITAIPWFISPQPWHQTTDIIMVLRVPGTLQIHVPYWLWLLQQNNHLQTQSSKLTKLNHSNEVVRSSEFWHFSSHGRWWRQLQ